MEISEVIPQLLACPDYTLPPAEYSVIFLASELGEVADELSRSWPEYVRMRIRNYAKSTMAEELADVLIMTCALARSLGIDLNSAVERKLAHLVERYGGGDE